MRARHITMLLSCLAAYPAAAEEGVPTWLYPGPPPGVQGADFSATRDKTPQRVPNSSLEASAAQTHDLFNVFDWHPDNHPPAPEIILRGHQPNAPACGFCHLPNGEGVDGAATLTGLPVEYFLRQLSELKSGTRKSTDPHYDPWEIMQKVASRIPDEYAEAAADYFAGVSPRVWIRVVEATQVPRVKFEGMFHGFVVDGTASEPIAGRIVEVPEDQRRTLLHDSESGYVAYVPPGSIKRGEALVTTGAKKTTACTACHGRDLRGVGPVPPIAGRSPSYVVRQLTDFQHGTRAGVWSALMKPVVATLALDDMVAIAAYTASREP